ncbi:uncharacterized protein LOC141632636 [Silene latifolia]|uniref:uncharacterized protein LOC141632636 n=1 Tax=Silene latifolia TaxID=37657 RepID=UPI003D774D84
MVDDKSIAGEGSSNGNPVYALSNQDGTGARITHVVLTGSKTYAEWAKGFRIALGAKRKLGFINGTLKQKPSNPKEWDDWTAVNYSIIAWIFNTIEPRLLANDIKLYQIQCNLADCKQKSGESLMDYYGRIKMLWDDINDYDALPTCDCCSKCDLQGVIRKRRDIEQVRGFLMGLDPAYATVRSSILGTTPLPDIHVVYARIARVDATANPMACAVTGKQQAKPEGAPCPRFKCSHCQKEGHTMSRFWEKNGFPVGHPRHVPRTEETSSPASSSSVKTNAVFGEPSVVTNMVRLNGKPSLTWIIDTGASTHVCYSEELFESCVSIPPINIGLPNGASLTATKAGTIKLNDKLSLDNDLALTTIGVGNLSDGLFYLTMEEPMRVNVVTGQESVALWHQRMGHPSSRSRDVHFIQYHFPFATPEFVFESSDLAAHHADFQFPEIEGGSENESSQSGNLSPSNLTDPNQNIARGEGDGNESSDIFDVADEEVHSNIIISEMVDEAQGRAITNDTEPTSFREAIRDPKWKKAMEEEIDALEANNTWSVVDLPPDKTAIGSMWVYKIKRNADGTVERYKARLVVFGNHQQEGIDFAETFAPTVNMVTVRTFLTIAAINNWELHQMDVQNAFLHGDLREEVYMRLPLGFGHGLRGKDDVVINIIVYVDDLVIAGNNSVVIQDFKNYLNQCFRMKDLGKLKYFLGLEVARNSSGIFLFQRKYSLDLLTETGLLGSKPALVPMEEKHELALNVEPLFPEPTKYRRLVGKLIYLTLTRPEITYSVHILSQFMQAPSQAHWDAVIRVIRYLKGNPGQGILLRADTSIVVEAYCDADYDSCPITRRSLSAYFVFLGGSPISWKTKKQATVSRSSAESEYRAMASATCEILWLKGLLRSLGFEHSRAVTLHCDNTAAIHISNNPVFHERTKHIEIDCHFVRDEIVRSTIAPSYVTTSTQLADILKKALGRLQFHRLLGKLGIANPYAPT